MASLGQTLREARERQGLSLDQIEASTRIRKSYLVAMEDETYDHLPHPTYVKGFLKTYAAVLGLDPAEVLDLYPLRDARPAITPVAKLEKPRLGGGFWVPVMLLLAVVAALSGFLYSSPWIAANLQGNTPAVVTDDVAPTIAPVSQAVPPSPRPEASGMTEAAPSTPSPAPLGVEIQARATANSWVWVIVDSTPVYTGTMRPGEEKAWTAQEKVFMRIGNAGGLIITHNGQQRGTLGNNGQVLDVQWTRDAMSFEANPPLPGPR